MFKSCLSKLIYLSLLCLLLPLPLLFAQSESGDIYLVPSTENITLNTSFYTELRVNSSNNKLGSYGVKIYYDPEVIVFDMEAADGGIDDDMNNFSNVLNSRTPGELLISGFCIQGAGPAADLHILNIYWKTLALGDTGFRIEIRSLHTVSAAAYTTQAGIPLDITINQFLMGDVDGNGQVDIIDALITARYYVGEPTTGFNPTAGDVNGNGSVDIIDALMIARYYVGILTEFPATPPTPPPAPTPFPEPVTITIKLVIEGGGKGSVTLTPTSAGLSLKRIQGEDGTENVFTYTIPGVLELMPYPSFSFLYWAGDLDSSEYFPRIYVDRSLYIEAHFSSIPTATPSPTPRITPTPRPTVTPAITPAASLTPTPGPFPSSEPGQVWLAPDNLTTGCNSTFVTGLYVNSGTQLLAAYGFTLSYDTTYLALNSTIGTNGVTAGYQGFVTAVNNDPPGTLVIAGFDTAGKGPGTALHLLTVNWLSLDAAGVTDLSLTINDLNDLNRDLIGIPRAAGARITIAEVANRAGDVNGDGVINIVDALMAAQYTVGLNPAGFIPGGSDVNRDGVINVIDALLIARYSAGLISSF